MKPQVRFLAPFLAALACSAAPARSADAPAPAAAERAEIRSRAAKLYDEGRFIEARPLLDQLDAAGSADGPTLYRLAFCQRSAGEVSAADGTQARAQERLVAEWPSAKSLEVPFYLANTYQNLSRTEDLARVTAEATGRYERGELGTAKSPADLFRLGKLYADQGNEAQATAWYARSIEAQTAAGLPQTTYSRWASRYLAEAKFRQQDFAAAQRYYSLLFAAGDASVVDLDRLAVCSARTGKFQEAGDAWKQAEILNPAEADRWRYSQRVAQLAAETQNLPGVAPSGKAWSALSREELEALLTEQSERVKTAVAEGGAEAPPPTPERREALRAQIGEARGAFVGAAIEYTARGLPIRETAFFGGYAPLLFRRAAWHLPHESPGQGKRKKEKGSAAASAAEEPTDKP